MIDIFIKDYLGEYVKNIYGFFGVGVIFGVVKFFFFIYFNEVELNGGN